MRFDEISVVARFEPLTLRELRLWVSEGWVRPSEDAEGLMFDELDVARIQLLCDLRMDMALPVDAIAPLLTVIDQLHRKRRELRWLTEAIGAQSDDVRAAIAASVRQRAEHSSSEDR